MEKSGFTDLYEQTHLTWAYKSAYTVAMFIHVKLECDGSGKSFLSFLRDTGISHFGNSVV